MKPVVHFVILSHIFPKNASISVSHFCLYGVIQLEIISDNNRIYAMRHLVVFAQTILSKIGAEKKKETVGAKP